MVTDKTAFIGTFSCQVSAFYLYFNVFIFYIMLKILIAWLIAGTSNWSADYFIDTGGIGLIVNQNKTQADVRQQVEDIFLRDWNSNYSTNIWDFPFKRHYKNDYHSEL